MNRVTDHKPRVAESRDLRESCRICGAAAAPRFRVPAIKRWSQEADFYVYWCADCDSGFVLPRPSEGLLESLYSSRYFADYGKAAESRVSPLDRAKLHLAWRLDRGVATDPELVESITGGSNAKVCDLGCGNGGLLAGLRERGFSVVGIEPSSFGRKEVEAKGMKVYEGTAERLPSFIAESPFDVVSMIHVLEHCLDPQLAIRNALGLLRDGGHLVIEVPNCGSYQFAVRGPAWYHFDPGRHVNYFSRGSLKTLVEGYGAKIVRYFYSQYLTHFTPTRVLCEASGWDQCLVEDCRENLEGIRRPSRLENWRGLVESCALKAERKYECLGIVARRG